jgi:hypothetical protein
VGVGGAPARRAVVDKRRGAAGGYGLDALSRAGGWAEEALRAGAAAEHPSVGSLLALLRAEVAAAEEG